MKLSSKRKENLSSCGSSYLWNRLSRVAAKSQFLKILKPQLSESLSSLLYPTQLWEGDHLQSTRSNLNCSRAL